MDPAMPMSDRGLVRRFGDQRKFAADTVIFERGDPGHSSYLIEEGQVRLLFGDGKDSKLLGVGESFGEIAFLLGDHKRSAGAVAETDAVLTELGPAAIESVLATEPQVLLRLFRTTTESLLQSERSLIESLKERNLELERTLDFLRRTREELDYQELLVQTDQLTGLYNRRCFDSQLEKAVERARRVQQPLTLLLFDLDGFKPVNDTFGHPAGDRVLKMVADALREIGRKSDLPCRFGGDEFAMVLPDCPFGVARTIALECGVSIRGLVPVPDSDLRVSASFGGAALEAGQTAADLVARADQELYRAKEAGKSCVAWPDREPERF